MTYQQHVLDEHLEAYVLRRLQEEETGILEDHLLLCQNCQRRLTETQQRIQAIRMAARGIREREERPGLRQSPVARFFSSLIVSRPAWAAAAAVAVALVVFTPRLRHSSLPYQEVNLTVMRGEEPAFDADHGRRLRLHLDVRDLEVSAINRMTIVSAQGSPVWESRMDRPTGDSVAVSIDRKLDAGQYWVRVLGPPDRILREYSLRLR